MVTLLASFFPGTCMFQLSSWIIKRSWELIGALSRAKDIKEEEENRKGKERYLNLDVSWDIE